MGVLESMAGGAASSAAGAITGQLLDLIGGYKKKMQYQQELQKDLLDYQLENTFNYNEKAADNAFNRQMQMYERQYEDQSYAAMRKQMEDAGLSVSLMYGTGGGSGGGAGATSGAPTGGAQSGGAAAPDAAAMEMAKAQKQQQSLAISMQKTQLEKEKALAQKAEAEAQKAKEDAGLTTEKKITEVQSRNAVIDNIYQEGFSKWIDNNRKAFNDFFSIEDNVESFYTHDRYGEYQINSKGTNAQEGVMRILKGMAEANDATASALLKDEQRKNDFMRVQTEIMKALAMGKSAEAAGKSADAAMSQARALWQKVENEAYDLKHKYGEELTTWQIIMLGVQVAGIGADLAGSIMQYKKGMAILETLLKGKGNTKEANQIQELTKKWVEPAKGYSIGQDGRITKSLF